MGRRCGLCPPLGGLAELLFTMSKAFLTRTRDAAVWATLGAGISGGIATIWAVVLAKASLIDPPLLMNGVVVFGISGLIIGMILSFIFGLIVDDKRALISLGSGILSGLGTGVLVPFVVLIFATRPWPSPKPYPGVPVTTQEIYIGSGWHHRTQTYTTSVSTDNLQQHYDEQMSYYCLDGWEFENSTDVEYANCLEASCNIRPKTDADPQYFYVHLCPTSETKTKVVQEDVWEFD